MRILVITADYPPYHFGGYELRCQSVLTNLKRRNHEIVIISNSTKPVESKAEDNIEIYRILHKSPPSTIIKLLLYDYMDLKFLEREIRAFRPDIIYLWHIESFSRALFPFFAKQRIPIVFDEGSNGLIRAWYRRGQWFNLLGRKSPYVWKQWVKSRLARCLYLLTQGIIADEWQWPDEMVAYFNNDQYFQDFKKHSIPLKRTLIIQSGLDTDLFKFLPKKLSSDCIKLLIVGRIVPLKRALDAIYIVSTLLSIGISTQLAIVGPIVSIDYFRVLEDEIRKRDLQNVVSFEGHQKHSDLVKYYHESTICLFLSNAETGLSRVPLEAMSTGCLIISYGNEGSSQVIQHEKTGFLVAEGNIIEIVEIIKLLISNEDLYEEIIANAREYVERNHTIDKYIDSIESLLMESVTL